jgi:hypothetical protein
MGNTWRLNKTKKSGEITFPLVPIANYGRLSIPGLEIEILIFSQSRNPGFYLGAPVLHTYLLGKIKYIVIRLLSLSFDLNYGKTINICIFNANVLENVMVICKKGE